MFYVNVSSPEYATEYNLFVDACNSEKLEEKLLKYLNISDGSLLVYDTLTESEYDGQITSYDKNNYPKHYNINLMVVETI